MGRERLHGLVVEAPFAFGGRSVAGDLPADVYVTWASDGARPRQQTPEGEEIAARGDRRMVVVRHPEGVLLWVPDLVEAQIDRDLAHVRAACDPVRRDLGAIVLSGNLMALLVVLRGACVLHGSAVEVDGHAIAFVGPSGAGKTTSAALGMRAGHRLVSDDLLRLEPDGSVHAGATAVRLRSFAAAALRDHLPSVEPGPIATADGRLSVASRPPTAAKLALRVIVRPRLVAPSSATTVREVRGRERLTALLGVPRVTGLRDEKIHRAQFSLLAEIAERVPIVDAEIPWPPADPALAFRDLLELLP